MKLIKSRYSNLFSLGNVGIDLNNRGLVLVTGYSEDEGGANGSGKSSLTSKGIIWVLYGTTTGGIKADNVINRRGKKKAWGEVEFEDSSGEKYLIRRERPSKLSLFKNGIDISSKTANDTQKLIDNAIGMNFATFIQTTFFGQGRKMSYASLTPKEQKSLLEQILPMEEIDSWAKYTDNQFKVMSNKVITAEKEEAAAATELRVIKDQYDEAVVSARSWESQQKAKINSLNSAREQILLGLQNKKDILKSLQEERAAIDIEDISNQITIMEALKTGSESSYFGVELKLAEATESTVSWNAEKNRLKAEIDKLNTSLVCPTCERDFGVEQTKLIAVKINELEKELKIAIHNHSKASEAKDHFSSEQETARVGMISSEDAINRLEVELARHGSLTDQINRLENDIKEAVGPIDAKIEFAEKENNPHLGYELNYQNKIKTATKNYNEASKRLGVANCELEHLNFWKNIYSKELKLKLFEECCAFLEDRTTVHLQELRNSQFHVEFSTIKRLANGDTKDDFSVNVWSETGGGSFDSLSGGEQQMVSFAIGLALSDLASIKSAAKPEFLILDEPFSELDARNSEAIVDYLSGALTKETVLLVSNEDSLKGLIPERIHVIKKHGVTNVQTQ